MTTYPISKITAYSGNLCPWAVIARTPQKTQHGIRNKAQHGIRNKAQHGGRNKA